MLSGQVLSVHLYIYVRAERECVWTHTARTFFQDGRSLSSQTIIIQAVTRMNTNAETNICQKTALSFYLGSYLILGGGGSR
jgi:hypothetical protein